MQPRKHFVGYSDGACKIPGKVGFYPGGWGSVLIHNNGTSELRWLRYGGKRKTTNNEMELTGLSKLLDIVPRGCHMTIRCDSMYVLQGIVRDGKGTLGEIQTSFLKKTQTAKGGEVQFSGWVGGWMKYGWKTKAGKPTANREVWEEIIAKCRHLVAEGTTLVFEHCKGHAGIEGNELADQLANKGVPT